jgi:hypothetical protein
MLGLTKAQEPSVNVVNSFGYRFDLHSIERKDDGSLAINVSVTRMDTYNKNLIFIRSNQQGTTRLLDQNGNEHVPESMSIDNKGNKLDTHLKLNMIQMVPVRVTYNVPKVDPELSMISLLEVAFSDRDYSDFIISFKDIKI